MLVIDGIIFKLQKHGGISVYFSNLIKFLSKKFNINYISYNDSYMVQLTSDSIIRKKYNIFTRFLDVDVPEGTKIFHSSYYRLPKKRLRKDLKVVTTVHDFTHEYFFNSFSSFLFKKIKYKAILNSDFIICISESTKRDLLKFVPAASQIPIKVVYNGASDDFYKISNINDVLINSPNLSFFNEHKCVLFVGGRASYKNFNLLVSLLSTSSEYMLIIVGCPLTNNEYELLNSKLNGMYKVFIFPDNHLLNILYNLSFCLIYPSDYEGFGIPVIEAMSAGCPVIAKNSSSLPEVVCGSGILLDTIDAVSLFDALVVLSCKSSRESYVLKGIENSKRFKWFNTFNEIESIYIDLLKD